MVQLEGSPDRTSPTSRKTQKTSLAKNYTIYKRYPSWPRLMTEREGETQDLVGVSNIDQQIRNLRRILFLSPPLIGIYR
jgi:ribosomal protein L39E